MSLFYCLFLFLKNLPELWVLSLKHSWMLCFFHPEFLSECEKSLCVITFVGCFQGYNSAGSGGSSCCNKGGRQPISGGGGGSGGSRSGSGDRLCDQPLPHHLGGGGKGGGSSSKLSKHQPPPFRSQSSVGGRGGQQVFISSSSLHIFKLFTWDLRTCGWIFNFVFCTLRSHLSFATTQLHDDMVHDVV